MLLIDLSVYSLFIPIIISLVRYKALSPAQWGVALYLYVSAITEYLANYLAHSQNNNLPLLHVYTAVEFSILFWVIAKLIELHIYDMLIVIAGFIVFAFINAFYIQSIYEFNTYARGFESLLLTGIALKYYHKVFTELKITHLEKEAHFWLSTAVLLYFSVNLFIFIFSNVIIASSQIDVFVPWWIHSILNIIFYLLFSTSFLCKNHQ